MKKKSENKGEAGWGVGKSEVRMKCMSQTLLEGRARESVNIWGNPHSFMNFPCYTHEVCECLILDQRSRQEKNFPANLW